MTLTKFVRKNRAAIDQTARDYGSRTPVDDEEREDWVFNDEFLYAAALQARIDI